ncbi:hypothetical protein ANCDUO_16373 [Ancylostoma duodenale]|uniref:Uncharacterized protein n=1 Tax=Ancylostoma duodenale TaxID=51022 RepID=A0A0C2CB25_9BILA|nr:hypothetical protein ANCDUO_16373 [Ancylostoma duodenale]
MTSKGRFQVIGDEFRSDPCALPHVCTPQRLGTDIANRIVYKELQRMREDPERFSGKTPYAVWDKLLWSAHSGEFDEEMGIDNEELRTDVEAGIHSADYQSRRLAISRGMNEITDDPVTLNNITASLAEFADGSRFLHEGPDEDLHIYYSEATLEVDHLRPHLQRHGIPESRLRVILDFEKAALRAAHKRTTPYTKFIPRVGKDPAVANWWNIFKGIPFLPTRLRREVTAFTTPPVPREHPAYKCCADFLAYLHETWLTGPFKDLWCKFGIYVLRTTNTAEAYHRKLKEVFKCAHPPLATLIKALRRLDLQSRCKLLHKEKNPNAEKQLRAQDRRRRENVEQCMRRFNGRYQTRGATNAEIERYCKKMSRFISNKAI